VVEVEQPGHDCLQAVPVIGWGEWHDAGERDRRNSVPAEMQAQYAESGKEYYAP